MIQSAAVDATAALIDRRGESACSTCMRETAWVFSAGWRSGQTSSTAQPTSFSAIASRAVAGHRHVVTSRTVGRIATVMIASYTGSRSATAPLAGRSKMSLAPHFPTRPTRRCRAITSRATAPGVASMESWCRAPRIPSRIRPPAQGESRHERPTVPCGADRQSGAPSIRRHKRIA